MEHYVTLIVFMAILGGLIALVRTLTAHKAKSLTVVHRLPYRRKDHLLTPAERSFYEVLCRAVGEDMQVFAQVRLADLVYVPEGTDKRLGYVNRVTSKHVDFVLCRRQTIAPVLAVELDNSTHNLPHRQRRDVFVNAVFEAAGLPLLRVPVKRSYDAQQLAREIGRLLDHGSVTPRRLRGKRA